MDFWNRLIGSTGSSSFSRKQRQPQPVTPEHRLARFKRIWQTILHTWRNARENDPGSQDVLQGNIKRLTELFAEEEKRSERICMDFAYEQQIYIALSKIAQSGSQGVIKETIQVFSALIDNEDEINFLAQESFAQSLMEFLKKTSPKLDPQLENDFVELLFNISAKIRLSPSILPSWFASNEGGAKDYVNLNPQQKFVGLTNKDDFPLFYLLIEYVHHEGRVGDFARTGLLYIIEAASTSLELERWIVESDLATLMASGLGALYSQLSRKLVVTYSSEEPPTILTLSDYTNPESNVDTSNSPKFQVHLKTFLSYLIFWQDVFEHCKSAEVKQTLLDHFQILFLQQLLYPSLLESSDLDGGSSVAVLTYVRLILDTLEHPELIHLILSYLMAMPEEKLKLAQVPQSPSVARRRKSLDLLTNFAKAEAKPTPDLFNLVDLVLTSLKSNSQQTVAATLRLVSTILRRHHPYSISTLLKVTPSDPNAPARTIGGHNKEINYLFSLVAQIAGEDDTTEASYEASLKDNLDLLESHPCTALALSVKEPQEIGVLLHLPAVGSRPLYKHTLRLDDPLLKNLVQLLSTFFSNAVETNLILTAVIIELASCCYMKTEGWLLFNPSEYEYEEDSGDEEEEEWAILTEDGADDPFDKLERKQMRSLERAQKEPNWKKMPPVIEVLDDLTSQIQAYRREIPDLDERIQERKNAFRLPDHINEALASSHIIYPQRNPIIDNIRNLAMPSSSTVGWQFDSGFSRQTISLNRGLRPGSPPIRTLSPNITASPSSPFGSHIMDTAQRRVRALHPTQFRPPPPDEDGANSAPGSARSVTPAHSESGVGTGRGLKEEFSLSHLLTNILILQEFVIELAALTQVRASLLEDVKFQ